MEKKSIESRLAELNNYTLVYVKHITYEDKLLIDETIAELKSRAERIAQLENQLKTNQK